MPNVQQMLDEIEADITAGDAQIARQRELIAELAIRGQGSAFAAEILKELEAIQVKQMALRDKLREELTSRARARTQPILAADSCPSSERM